MATFIVEADGGSRGNPGPAAYGTVVRDAAGALLVGIGEYIGEATNNVAEYRGMIAGITAALELDANATIEVRLDSKLVVEQMSGRWKIKHPDMRELAMQANALIDRSRVSFTWVPRAQNAAADAMVNRALDSALQGGPTLIRTDAQEAAAEDVVGDIEAKLAESKVKVSGWVHAGPVTTTVLARHGSTNYSLEKKFSGSGGADMPLNDVGEAQARALAHELRQREALDLIIASPILRTRQTAQFVADALGVDVVIEPGIAECAFGEWDGFTFGEVEERWPHEMHAWLADPDVAPPGGESLNQVNARVRAAIERITAEHEHQRVLLVSHVTPIKLTVAAALNAPLATQFRMELRPCSITTVNWYPNGHASVFGFAESAHLRGI